MREIVKIEYTKIIESDVDDYHIYAFAYGHSFTILSKKDDKYFWKDLKATNHVWYKMYDTIESALEGITEVEEFKGAKPTIYEFTRLNELVDWMYVEQHKEKDV